MSGRLDDPRPSLRGPARLEPLPMFGAMPPDLADSVTEEPTLPLDLAATPQQDAAEAPAFPPPPEGAGPLVAAAWPLLSLLARLRAGAVARPETLKAGCIAAIRRYETQAMRAGLAADLVHAGRYALCSAIDEQVLGTPWGDVSDWSAGSLLATFHNETWGGEKVFAIVDVALASSGQQRDLTELLFHLLSLGFQGRYRLRRDGTTEVEGLREQLYRALRPGLGEAPAAAAAPPPAPPRTRWTRGGPRRLRSWPPVWVVGAASALFALLAFVTYEALLYARSERLATALLAVDRAPPPPPRVAAPLPPVPAPIPANAAPPLTLTPGGIGEYPRPPAPGLLPPGEAVGGLGVYAPTATPSAAPAAEPAAEPPAQQPRRRPPRRQQPAPAPAEEP